MNFENSDIEGARVGLLRQRLGLNQKEFGASIGLTQPSISEIEKGSARISYDKLKVLHQKYGYSINFHISGIGKLIIDKEDRDLSTRSINENEESSNSVKSNSEIQNIIDENQKLSTKVEQLQLQNSLLNEKLNNANEKLILANEKYIGLLERTKSSGSQGVLGVLTHGK